MGGKQNAVGAALHASKPIKTQVARKVARRVRREARARVQYRQQRVLAGGGRCVQKHMHMGKLRWGERWVRGGMVIFERQLRVQTTVPRENTSVWDVQCTKDECLTLQWTRDMTSDVTGDFPVPIHI